MCQCRSLPCSIFLCLPFVSRSNLAGPRSRIFKLLRSPKVIDYASYVPGGPVRQTIPTRFLPDCSKIPAQLTGDGEYTNKDDREKRWASSCIFPLVGLRISNSHRAENNLTFQLIITFTRCLRQSRLFYGHLFQTLLI
jgi:hypothetical protein